VDSFGEPLRGLAKTPGGSRRRGVASTPHDLHQGPVRRRRLPRRLRLGHARALSPLVDHPVEGPVYLRSPPHPLPDLVIALWGPAEDPIEIEAAGRIDSVNGGIRFSFEAPPGLPVSKFVLNMEGGRKGLLVNSTNLCARASRASIAFTAQNGRARGARPVVRADCNAGREKR
jgi:hypothetical protein